MKQFQFTSELTEVVLYVKQLACRKCKAQAISQAKSELSHQKEIQFQPKLIYILIVRSMKLFHIVGRGAPVRAISM